jgi:hypothetical protein
MVINNISSSSDAINNFRILGLCIDNIETYYVITPNELEKAGCTLLNEKLPMIRREEIIGSVRLSYKPYFFSQRTVFFSHNKSVNSTFSRGFSAKRTGPK